MTTNTNSAQERTASIDLAQLDKLIADLKRAELMDDQCGNALLQGHGVLMDLAWLKRVVDFARSSLTSGSPAEPVAQVDLDNDCWLDIKASEIPGWEVRKFKTRTLYTAPVHDAAAPSDEQVMSEREFKQFCRILTVAGVAGAETLDQITAMACFFSLIGQIASKLEGANRMTGAVAKTEQDCYCGGWDDVHNSGCPEATAAGAGSAQPRAEGDERTISEMVERARLATDAYCDGLPEEPSKAHSDAYFYRTLLALTRAPLPAQEAQPVDDARDAARLDMIDQIIRENGYIYLHNNRAREPIGLLVKPGELREALDGFMERRATMRANDSAAEGGAK